MMSRYLPYSLALVALVLAFVFLSLWQGETQRPERQLLNTLRTDIISVISGATCEFNETSDPLQLAILTYAPTPATFHWQMIIPGIGVVWEHTEITNGQFFYTSPSRGITFTAQPQPYRTLTDTPIRIEASAYYGERVRTRPDDFSMIEFNCRNGEIMGSLLTEEVAE